MLAAVRGHWSIENRLHWCLDVCFCEDQRRLRQDRTIKVGLQAKRKRAGWDHGYLLHLISQA